MTVEVVSGGLKVGERFVPVISGAVHYWRHERELWKPILRKVKGMGFEMVETYIPWSVHETARSEFDFGDSDPSKDIDAYLALCKEMDLLVMVRPGPHINSELTYFGYPERVLADPKCQSVSATGTPIFIPTPPRMFPAPSYASEKFFKEVEVWYDAICPILEKHLFPQGNLVAIQVDNEMSLFFHDHPFDYDYSPGSAKLYCKFLENTHGEVEHLNEVYGTKYSSFSQVPMPRKFEAKSKSGLPYYLDWACFKEYYIISSLKRLALMLKEKGIRGIPVFHNYPTGDPASPFNMVETERSIDIQGIDMYPTRREYVTIKHGCLHASGASRLPFIPEFSSGCWPWFRPISLDDQRFTTLAAWMHGIKAMNFYMLVERERWYGSPVTRDGRIRDDYYEFFKDFVSAIKQSGLSQLELAADIMLLHVRDYGRLQNLTSLFDPISPLILKTLGASAEHICREDTFGFKAPIQIEHDKVFNCWLKGLTSSRYPFILGDTEMDVGTLSKCKVIIVPTFEFLGQRVQEKLAEYAREGGVLIIGPTLPELDDRMRRSETLKEAMEEKIGGLNGMGDVYSAGKGRIVSMMEECRADAEFLQKLVETVDDIAGLAGIKRSFPPTSPGVETSFHFAPDNKESGVLFIANPTGKKKNTTIETKPDITLQDLFSSEKITSGNSIEVSIEPWSIRMFEVKA